MEIFEFRQILSPCAAFDFAISGSAIYSGRCNWTARSPKPLGGPRISESKPYVRHPEGRLLAEIVSRALLMQPERLSNRLFVDNKLASIKISFLSFFEQHVAGQSSSAI